jgi:hypothetical protein
LILIAKLPELRSESAKMVVFALQTMLFLGVTPDGATGRTAQLAVKFQEGLP